MKVINVGQHPGCRAGRTVVVVDAVVAALIMGCELDLQFLLNNENRRFRDAVTVDADGFYAVKYDELGLKMLTLEEWRAVDVLSS